MPLGEIGKNVTVLEYGCRMLVVDAGRRFPTPEMHGIDLVMIDEVHTTWQFYRDHHPETYCELAHL